ncbi:MAG TPA: glycoside hydrolase [Terriglobales bacterium]|nr:glycoside hydrolase [Terriglobales bacterium]
MSSVRKAVVIAFLLLLVPAAFAQATGAIDFTSNLQRIDGFGAAIAFQRSNLMHGLTGLTPENQARLMDLLFSQKRGIGLSIVRLGVGSSPTAEPYDSMHSIQPVDPGGPDAPPQYVWNHDDDGQVWVSTQASLYGVRRFLASPWSAPGYMKTNGTDKNGGSLCGLTGTTCASGDWRQAYANYLAQYLKFYQQEGLQITDFSLQNELNFTATYASMRYTTGQAVEMIKILGPTIKAASPTTNIVCCEPAQWNSGPAYNSAILADPVASSYTDIFAGHEYGSAARTPYAGGKTVWMTEWGLNGSTWNAAWDLNETQSRAFVLANDIMDALRLGNINAYVYWVAGSLGATRAFVQIPNPGPDFVVSKRLYAMGAFSKFIRPNAYRVSANTTNSNVKITAFRNASGSKVIEIINNATTPIQGTYTLDAGSADAVPTTYVSDETHDIGEVGNATISGTTLTVTLPRRSLTTIVLPPQNIEGTEQLAATTTLSKFGDGTYQATVKITNKGTGTIENVSLTSALLGAATGTTLPESELPQSLGSIAPGGYMTTSVTFPASAGPSGSASVARFTGTYDGGTFSTGLRVMLP